jgi:dephospho-CoA kinase
MKIGLTGGMGCGKSFVLSCFAELGWATVESDAIVRRLLEGDSNVADALRIRFGRGVFGPDGRPDRAAIARQVFADTDSLRDLEAILHPRVRVEWERQAAASSSGKVVVEIPLLFEKKLEKHFDLSVCVTASQPTQLERLAGRGFGKDEALARMARQLPLHEKEQRSDFVISNNGIPSTTRAQVRLLASRL